MFSKFMVTFKGWGCNESWGIMCCCDIRFYKIGKCGAFIIFTRLRAIQLFKSIINGENKLCSILAQISMSCEWWSICEKSLTLWSLLYYVPLDAIWHMDNNTGTIGIKLQKYIYVIWAVWYYYKQLKYVEFFIYSYIMLFASHCTVSTLHSTIY